MKKADQKRLSDALDKALLPPRNKPKLDALLNDYDEEGARGTVSSTPPSTTTGSSSSRAPSASRVTTSSTDAREAGLEDSELSTTFNPYLRDTASRASSVAPQRDFMKVPNSITREALPSGMFVGKAKQLYDYLYSQTRGGFPAKRTTRISKLKIMAAADIGSEVTLRKNLNHLRAVGLIRWEELAGMHGGNEYTVFVPEEIRGSTHSRGSRDESTSYTSYYTEGLAALEPTGSRASESPEESRTYSSPKTPDKTSNNDDERFASFIEIMISAEREVTGITGRSDWKQLAEVLRDELREAARHTAVSSVPAFLAEHLRRRLTRTSSSKTAGKGAYVGKQAIDSEESRLDRLITAEEAAAALGSAETKKPDGTED